MSWINYLLEANLYLALFYGAYYLLLRRETFYQLNRAFLLGSSALAFIIPVFQLGFLKPVPVAIQNTQLLSVIYTAPIAHLSAMPVIATPPPPAPTNYYLLIYGIMAGIMAISFIFRVLQLARLARRGKHSNGDKFHLIEMEDNENAFSFFGYLFISKKLTASGTIIQHELVHIRQRHSLDIIYLELMKIVCWFNPAVYLLQNSIRELHEYIADSHIANAQQDVHQYTDFLISNAYGLPETALTNNFFNKNLLKKRIMMLHQKKSGGLARLKLLVALPLLGGMLCLSTLGFTKDYHVFDLAPRHIKENPVIKPFVKQAGNNKILIKNPNGTIFTTDKLSFSNPDGTKKMYTANNLTNTDIKALAKKGLNVRVISDVEVTHYLDSIKHKVPPPPSPAMYSYLQNTVKYPEDALKNKKQGMVYAGFSIDDNRQVTNAKIINSAGTAMDAEVLNDIKRYKGIPADKPGVYGIVIEFVIDKLRPAGAVLILHAKADKNGDYPPPPPSPRITTPPTVVKPPSPPAMPPVAHPTVVKPPPPPAMPPAAHPTVVKPPPPPAMPPAAHPTVVKPPPPPAMPTVARPTVVKPPPPPVVPTSANQIRDTTSQKAYAKFADYLGKSIRYPREAREKNIGGKVFVVFNVNDDYTITNVNVLRGLTNDVDDELVRSIKAYKGTQGMKPGLNYTIPISFSLANPADGKNIPTNLYINPSPTKRDYKRTGFKEVALNEIVVTASSLAKPPPPPADPAKKTGKVISSGVLNNTIANTSPAQTATSWYLDGQKVDRGAIIPLTKEDIYQSISMFGKQVEDMFKSWTVISVITNKNKDSKAVKDFMASTDKMQQYTITYPENTTNNPANNKLINNLHGSVVQKNSDTPADAKIIAGADTGKKENLNRYAFLRALRFSKFTLANVR